MITQPHIPDPYAAPFSVPPAYPAPAPSGTAAWKKVLTALATAVVLGSMIFGGIMLKSMHDQQARTEAIASSSSRAAASSSAAAESSKRAAEQAAEAERSSRRAAVPEIEASVRTMAQKHIATGLLTGPILWVTCDPVTGALNDLTVESTTFDCFVATERVGDGAARGYHYHATMSWTSGRYTYGYGAP